MHGPERTIPNSHVIAAYEALPECQTDGSTSPPDVPFSIPPRAAVPGCGLINNNFDLNIIGPDKLRAIKVKHRSRGGRDSVAHDFYAR